MKHKIFLSIFTLLFAASAFAGTIDLSQVTPDEESIIHVQDGDVLTGVLDGEKRPYKVLIDDNATVTLKDATINGESYTMYMWAGITCAGNCNIVLADNSVNKVRGFYRDYPGVYVPEGHTLTISGTGSLDASSNGYGAGIGGADYSYEKSCGNIVINGGTITATGGYGAAGIGGGYKGNVGYIKISGTNTKVTAIKGQDAPYSIGSGDKGSMNGSVQIDYTIEQTTQFFETPGIAASPFNYPVAPYTVIFDANGGEGDMAPQMALTNFEQALDANRFTREGYSFVGWNTKVDDSGESYADKGYVTYTEAGASVTLYARWFKGDAINFSYLTEDYVAKNGDVLVGVLGGNHKISIEDGAKVTLAGVTINGVNDSKYKWAGITCEGDCEIVLADNSKNTVKGFHEWYPGIYVPKNKTLTISGSGFLDVSSNGSGAGIGGGFSPDAEKMDCGNITILDGIINAKGGSGAGIGGGYYAYVGNITISGGTITASSRTSAGIGQGTNSGRYTDVGDITISGGTVTAIGGNYGAGIGGAQKSIVQNITISGGTVNATGEWGAGIGSGREGYVYGNVTISGGTVNATADYAAAGIGSGYQGRCNKITISGGTVIATGGELAAGIGSGHSESGITSYAYDIIITDGLVTATGGDLGAGIGSGYYGEATNISISGGMVTAIAGSHSAGVGAGCEGKVFGVTISGGTVDATGDYLGAGVGGGKKGPIQNITISGGTVTATGGAGGSGVGGGFNGSVDEITISGGTVTATGGRDGSGVGSGEGSSVKNITISGGTVTAAGTEKGAGVGTSYEGIISGAVIIENGRLIALGGNQGAGIGAGEEGKVGEVRIWDGWVTATGGAKYGAGVGCSWDATVDGIVILGGTVEAEGGRYAAGIGGGYYGDVGEILISDNVDHIAVTKGSSEYSIGKGDGGKRGKIAIGGTEYKDIEDELFIYPADVTQYGAVQIRNYNSGTRAVIDGMYDELDTVDIPKDTTVTSVVYKRKFTTGEKAYSTIVFPFEVHMSRTYGVKMVLGFNGLEDVTKNGVTKKAVTMKVVWADTTKADVTLAANTPYMVLMKGEKFEVDGSATLKATKDSIVRVGDWEFRGTRHRIVWDADHEDLGNVYGFSAEKTATTDVGKFVKAAAGAWIRPMRAYMIYAPETSPENVPGNGRPAMSSIAPADLPEELDVVIKGDDEEHTTVIGRINTRTGEFKNVREGRLFDLKGRGVNGKPKAKGVYLKRVK